jgi:RND superfamily putative drug exporter
MRRLPRLLLRPRLAWVIAVLGFLVTGAGIAAWGEAANTPSSTATLVAGADSTRVVELQERLPQGGNSTAIAVFSADQGSLSADALTALCQAFAAQLAKAPAASGPALSSAPGPRSPSDGSLGCPVGAAGPVPLILSTDRTAAIGVLPVAATGNTEISAAVATLRADLRAGAPQGVSVQVTGPAAIQADLGAVFNGADTRLLLATAGVVALLLLITYRSPALWVVPLLVVGAADRLAGVVATHVMAATGVQWDESTIGILSVLVFGAGTDYALLLISRYRDELRTTDDRYAAMARAVRYAGEAVLASATTVVLGLLTLVLSVVPTTRGLGVACAVGVVVAMVFALVVLPTTLVLFGRWIFWPVVPREGQTQAVDSQRSVWHRVGMRVAARPVVFVVAGLAMLGALSLGLTQVRTGLPTSEQFLQKPEAIAAADRIAQSFPAGSADPTVVVTPTATVQQVIRQAGTAPGVASATPGRAGDGMAQVDVVFDVTSGSPQAEQAVTALRASLDGIPETYVGGSEAQAVDASSGAARDRLVLFPLILGLVLAALVVLLRSAVAPLILVATVVGTYLAAMGASWWIFSGVFGFTGMADTVPLIAFLFLVALGVDYNIFLVTRAREESHRHIPRDGMLRALTATGGVITSAGILLAAVFAVLGVLPLVVLAQIGIVIGVGVLLDTLLVRTVLVPALAILLGDRFWWPRSAAQDAGTVGQNESDPVLTGR